VEFFSKLICLWTELDSYVRIPKCKCNAAKKIAKMNEEEKVHQFLIGLDDENYSTVRSQILAHDPLPSIDKIFNMVQQAKNHRKVMMNRDTKQDSMAAFVVTHIN